MKNNLSSVMFYNHSKHCTPNLQFKYLYVNIDLHIFSFSFYLRICYEKLSVHQPLQHFVLFYFFLHNILTYLEKEKSFNVYKVLCKYFIFFRYLMNKIGTWGTILSFVLLLMWVILNSLIHVILKGKSGSTVVAVAAHHA